MEQIGELEKRLWLGADTLRANSNFASNEYFLPVMGLIFLRHTSSRFLRVKDEIEAKLPTRRGKKRELYGSRPDSTTTVPLPVENGNPTRWANEVHRDLRRAVLVQRLLN